MTTLDVIYEDDWLTDTLTKLHDANDAAKAISRRGLVAMLRPEYAAAHSAINTILDELEVMV